MKKIFFFALALLMAVGAMAKKPFTIHAETQGLNLIVTITPEDNSRSYFYLLMPDFELNGMEPETYFILIKQNGMSYADLLNDGAIKTGLFQYVFEMPEEMEEGLKNAAFIVSAVHVDENLNETSEWVKLTFTIADGLDVTTEDSPYKEENGWVYYDDGIMVTPFGPGSGTFHWGIMYPASTLEYSTLYKIALYESIYNTDPISLAIRTGGETPNKATTIHTQTIQPSGNAGLHVVPLTQALNFNNEKNLWITLSAPAGWPAVVCANTGDPNSRWYSMNGTTWGDLAETSSGGNKNDYSFMIRACFNADEAVDQIQKDKVQSTKMIRNGQLFILVGDKLYDAQGKELK